MQACSSESGVDLVVGREQEYAVEVAMQLME
jgi:electron transfer flavoprotein alpha/beta subunit